jgi:hypothetical protein
VYDLARIHSPDFDFSTITIHSTSSTSSPPSSWDGR